MSDASTQALADIDRAIEIAKGLQADLDKWPTPQQVQMLGFFALVGMGTCAVALIGAAGFLVWAVCKALG